MVQTPTLKGDWREKKKKNQNLKWNKKSGREDGGSAPDFVIRGGSSPTWLEIARLMKL